MSHTLTRIAQSVGVCAAVAALVQAPGIARQFPGEPPGGGPPPFGQGGRGGFGGVQPDLKIVARFDKDGDKRLNAAERKAALEYMTGQGGRGGPGGGRGRIGGFRGGGMAAGTPGPKLAPADVRAAGNAPLYGPTVLRTLFLEFEDANWEDGAHGVQDVRTWRSPPHSWWTASGIPDVGVRFPGHVVVHDGPRRAEALDQCHDGLRPRRPEPAGRLRTLTC